MKGASCDNGTFECEFDAGANLNAGYRIKVTKGNFKDDDVVPACPTGDQPTLNCVWDTEDCVTLKLSGAGPVQIFVFDDDDNPVPRQFTASTADPYCIELAYPNVLSDYTIVASGTGGTVSCEVPARPVCNEDFSNKNESVMASAFVPLNNGFEVIATGIGAGGAATATDGLGYWVPGEDLHGATTSPATGDFSFAFAGFRELVCILDPGASSNLVAFPHISFYEVPDSANCPTCFDNPVCASGVGSALLSSVIGYPSSCFVLLPVPSAFTPSILPSAGFDVLVPGVGSSLQIIAALNGVSFPIPSCVASGVGCFVTQFHWQPSVLSLTDDLGGLWSYRQNSPYGNQYWGLSNDEVNVWKSNTWVLLGDQSAVLILPANADYAAHLLTTGATTTAALAPAGNNGSANPYYAGPLPNGMGLDPNQGFDVGRGARAIALSGSGGAKGPLGFGNQDPANNPQVVSPTLGFLTWDASTQWGSTRIVMASLDVEGLSCLPTNTLFPDITKAGVRLPVNGAGFTSFPSVNTLFGPLFLHETASGFPDPDGLPAGSFGLPTVAGHTNHIPVGPTPSVCVGVPVNITYGSVGLTPGGKLDLQQEFGAVSGSHELFLMP